MHTIQARFGPYRYQFKMPLVRTQMSELWIAEEKRSPEKPAKTVAVKIALLHSEDRKTYSRANQLAIENEERWLTDFRNQHPNIVKLRQIAEEGSSHRRVYRARSRMDGKPWFIVTDYLPGGDLNNLLKQRKQLPALLALEIAERISDALAFIHARDCVHCDIKTRNILFEEAPDGLKLTPASEPILIDFGIAKDSTVSEQRVTGTPRWMPPEARAKMDRAEKQQPEESWDTYGLGLVLYSMLSHRAAHAGKESKQAWVRFDPEHFVQDPSVADPKRLATELNRLLERATHDDPEQRLAAADFTAELQQLQRLTRIPKPAKAPAQSKRKRWPVLVMMLLLVASMIGAWFLLAPAETTDFEEAPLITIDNGGGSGPDAEGGGNDAGLGDDAGLSDDDGEDVDDGAVTPGAVKTSEAIVPPAADTETPTLAPTATATAEPTNTITDSPSPKATATLDTVDDGRRPTSTRLATRTPLVTSTSMPTVRPTSTPRPTQTPRPSATPAESTNTPDSDSPVVDSSDKTVVLQSPLPVQTFEGEVRFRWSPQFTPAANECFEVRVWDGGGGNWRNGYGVRNHGKETDFAIRFDAKMAERLANMAGRTLFENGHPYHWGVVLTTCEPYKAIELISESREFRYGAN